MAEKIGMARSHFNKGLKKLLELGVFEKGPKIGRMVSLKLNPEYGWKGSAQNHIIALKQVRKDKMKQARISAVIEGGKTPKGDK